MGNVADNKFTWVIKNFSSLQPMHIYSDTFVIGGCKWRLESHPKRSRYDKACFLFLYLRVADSETLPSGWRRRTKFQLTIVNQLSEKHSKSIEGSLPWFDQKSVLGPLVMLPLTKLMDRTRGFLVNDEVKIVVVIDVIEVIGKLDVPDASEEAIQPLKRVKRENVAETAELKKSIDVNGFQVLPSQVEFVSRVLKKYPDLAVVFRAKNQHLRTACMHVLLSLIETLCKSLEELPNDDLVEADNSLTYLKHSGFKLDWLEKKLDEVKAKKKNEEIGETQMQELEEELKVFNQKCSELEEELKDFKQKCSDNEALLEKEKAEMLAARGSPLTLDDFV